MILIWMQILQMLNKDFFKSCKEIKDNNSSSSDWIYSIDADWM